jgi:hypothetical protein
MPVNMDMDSLQGKKYLITGVVTPEKDRHS